MNDQIELSDEQLELVIGGAASGIPSIQTNVAGVLQVPIAIAVSPNIIVFGDHNTQSGAAALAGAGAAIGQHNS